VNDPAPDADPDDADAPGRPDGRYAHLETADQLVIYDRENHRAWIQSDAAVAAAAMA
jgi:hypothetical protein